MIQNNLLHVCSTEINMTETEICNRQVKKRNKANGSLKVKDGSGQEK